MLQIVRTVAVNTRYGGFEIPSDETALSRSLKHYGEWAQADVDFLLRLIGEGGVAIDADASVGAYAIPIARRVGATGQTHAFTSAALAPMLRRNVISTEVRRVSVYPATLDAQVRPADPDWSERLEADTLALVAEADGRGGDPIFSGGRPRPREAELALNLDALGIASCDLLRLSCDGMEWRALVGGSELIASARPYISVDCQDVGAAWTATALLLSQGYSAWLYSWPTFNPDNFTRNHANIFGGSVQSSIFFLPPERADGQLVMGVSALPFERISSLHGLTCAYNAAHTGAVSWRQ
ncbi:MAG TPA: hypothetical protein VFU60_02775 [Ktedonobacterales bacterium]|nr:hypothetical protein [Ktedonobacterales bacterium]